VKVGVMEFGLKRLLRPRLRFRPVWHTACYERCLLTYCLACLNTYENLGRAIEHRVVAYVVLCDNWNWSHDNDTVSGIEYCDTIAIPEVHTKR